MSKCPGSGCENPPADGEYFCVECLKYDPSKCPDCGMRIHGPATCPSERCPSRQPTLLQIYRLIKEGHQQAVSARVEELESLVTALTLCPYPLHDHMTEEQWEAACKIARKREPQPTGDD